ncbi:uncharacterized protein G2W53_028448 [Senna tora]|uniref:Uncharacterized protein n=1 Tax=Senna tora TaxID=362788 RepID=A0A834T2C7_9FABA|nr:uncharacterized protein G2W53_028448 [Senna tora]
MGVFHKFVVNGEDLLLVDARSIYAIKFGICEFGEGVNPFILFL